MLDHIIMMTMAMVMTMIALHCNSMAAKVVVREKDQRQKSSSDKCAAEDGHDDQCMGRTHKPSVPSAGVAKTANPNRRRGTRVKRARSAVPRAGARWYGNGKNVLGTAEKRAPRAGTSRNAYYLWSASKKSTTQAATEHACVGHCGKWSATLSNYIWERMLQFERHKNEHYISNIVESTGFSATPHCNRWHHQRPASDRRWPF